MRLIRNTFILGLLFCTFSCAEKEVPNPDLQYTLILENTLTQSVDVYYRLQSEIGEDFVLGTTAISGSEGQIEELVIGEAYLLRMVNSGRPISEFFDERAIANVDSEQTELRIQIQE